MDIDKSTADKAANDAADIFRELERKVDKTLNSMLEAYREREGYPDDDPGYAPENFPPDGMHLYINALSPLASKELVDLLDELAIAQDMAMPFMRLVRTILEVKKRLDDRTSDILKVLGEKYEVKKP